MSISNQINQLKTLLSQKNYNKFDQVINSAEFCLVLDKNIIHNFKGYRYLATENLSLAEEHFKKALEIKKTFDVLTNLGVTYLKMGDYFLSEKYLKESMILNKTFSDNYIFLSKCYVAQEQFDKAVKTLEEGSIFSKPIDLVLKSFARMSLEIKEYDLAIALYSRVKKIFPKDFHAYNNLGVSYEALNQFDLAKRNYIKAVNLNPSFEDGLCNLGNLYRSEGDFAQAEKYFLQALKVSKHPSKIYRYLSVIYKFKSPDDTILSMMLELKDNKKNALKDEHELYFAIYKAYEDLKDLDSSIKYLNLANKTKRSSLNYSNHHQKIHFQMMKDIFKNNQAKILEIPKKPSKAIFIVGMPRSGTTLVEQIISSHSKITSGGELFYLQKYIKKYFPAKDPEIFKSSVLQNLNIYGPEIAIHYNMDIEKISKNKIVTDKLPFNFVFIGFIKSIFKDVKIIHCSRSPMETCFSIYKNYFPFDELGFAYNQKELGEYYRLYYDLMKYWKDVYKDEIFELKYENLISDQEMETKKLLSYCNLEWENECLDFYKNNNVVKTLSTNQVRQPIYKSSLNSWKKYGNHLSELAENLGDLFF
jgi:tetratricopeptide (TPR) repeat protein